MIPLLRVLVCSISLDPFLFQFFEIGDQVFQQHIQGPLGTAFRWHDRVDEAGGEGMPVAAARLKKHVLGLLGVCQIYYFHHFQCPMETYGLKS